MAEVFYPEQGFLLSCLKIKPIPQLAHAFLNSPGFFTWWPRPPPLSDLKEGWVCHRRSIFPTHVPSWSLASIAKDDSGRRVVRLRGVRPGIHPYSPVQLPESSRACLHGNQETEEKERSKGLTSCPPTPGGCAWRMEAEEDQQA